MKKKNKNHPERTTAASVWSDYFPWKYPSCWFKNIKRWFHNCRMAWQRARYGWCEDDVWDVHSYLLTIVPQMVRYSAARSIGIPDEIYEQYAEVCDTYAECDEQAAAAWDAILDTIATKLEHAAAPEKYLINEYQEAFDELIHRDGLRGVVSPHRTDEECEIVTNYSRRAREIYQWGEREFNDALDLFKKWHWYIGD